MGVSPSKLGSARFRYSRGFDGLSSPWSWLIRDSCGAGRVEEGRGCGGAVGVWAVEEEGVLREGCV